MYTIYVKTLDGWDVVFQSDDFDEVWDEFNTLQAADKFNTYKLVTSK